MMRRIYVVGGLCAVAVAAAVAYSVVGETSQSNAVYRTAKVERGSIVKSISAAGKLNAMVSVKVGSQISGRVSELLADFNSEVRKDQVIARIDPTTFEAKVNEARADLEVAKAHVLTQEAAVEQARANAANARASLAASEAELQRFKITAADLARDHQRLAELRGSGAASASAVEKSRALWQAAEAQVRAATAQIAAQNSQINARESAVAMAEADVVHARAQVEQKVAVHRTATVNLDNTFIRSPVDGVVIGRDVDVGTVVAASLQAPTLFSIAQDLREMQVEASIDEADIGQIEPGQPATFTVDSFLGREFRGRVLQVRKQPKEVQNVVTYTVVITADNADLSLLPGMTANVEVRVSDRANVLKVPSAAFRFRPPDAPVSASAATAGGAPADRPVKGPSPEAIRERAERFAADLSLDDEQKRKVREINADAVRQTRMLRDSAEDSPAAKGAPAQIRRDADRRILELLRPDQQAKFKAMIARRRSSPATPARVWVLDDGRPKEVPVFVGVNDNAFGELVRGALEEGQEVIVGIDRNAARAGGRLLRLGF